MVDSIAVKDTKDEHKESLNMIASLHDRVVIESREPYGPSGMHDNRHIIVNVDLF